MIGYLILSVFVVCALILGIAYAADRWSDFHNKHLRDWICNVQNGLCSRESRGHEIPDDASKIVCKLHITPFLAFLAKRTQCRVVKYNNAFYTEIKTWGTGWTEFSKLHIGRRWTSTNKWDTLEEAEEVCAQAVADIQCWLDNSVPEDPLRYKRVVVAQQTVTKKETT